MSNQSSKGQRHLIPAPADKPNYRTYAAGAPGDMRPWAKRLAEKIARDHGFDPIFAPIPPGIFEAIEFGINAGVLHERDRNAAATR